MFFINETAVAQYKNQADYASNAYGPQPLNRTDVGKTVSLLMDPDRGHYASTMGFFASGNFTRHTAPDGYVAAFQRGRSGCVCLVWACRAATQQCHQQFRQRHARTITTARRISSPDSIQTASRAILPPIGFWGGRSRS